ncbi:RHS repeat protein [Paenibacillus daejeonensis]|uniref:RHS repeat protein n=1 Tax=Paenibacillus daejeonensis TaxID=135193 RepID=UPI00146DA406|nr:RHS repeat domain-containing protein [Paenibacillus daejeonensis]
MQKRGWSYVAITSMAAMLLTVPAAAGTLAEHPSGQQGVEVQTGQDDPGTEGNDNHPPAADSVEELPMEDTDDVDQEQKQDNTWHKVAGTFDLSVSTKFTEGWRVAFEDSQIEWLPVDASSAQADMATDEPNLLSYLTAWLDTDVTIHITADTLVQTWTLHTADAPHTFTYELVGSLPVHADLAQWNLQPLQLIDAAGTEQDVLPVLRTEGERRYLDLSFSGADLAYPAQLTQVLNFQTDELSMEESTADLLAMTGADVLYTYTYDVQGRLSEMQLSTGGRIVFTYDAQGNLTQREFIGDVSTTAMTEADELESTDAVTPVTESEEIPSHEQ